MSIRVTCPKCHARFNVSEKFAGRSGPCPKCKSTIAIPKQEEQIVIAEPEHGPKDASGRSILKPIGRTETRISSVQLTIIICAIVGFLLAALVLNIAIADKSKFPGFILWISAIAIALPICYAGYTFLRDPELGSFLGRELWTRIGICAVVYALTWLAMPLGKFAFSDSYEIGAWVIALVLMLGVGGAAGMLSFDFDYLTGLLHYGLYLGLCIIGRLICGIGVLPQNGADTRPVPTVPEVDPLEGLLWHTVDVANQLIAMI